MPQTEAGQLGVIRRKHQDPNFSPGREKEEWNVHPMFWLFWGLPKGQLSVSNDSVLMGNQHSLEAWAPQRSRKSSVACCNNRELVVKQRDTEKARYYKLLKEKPAYSLHTQVQRRCILWKPLRDASNLKLSWLVKVFPCTKSDHKDQEKQLFFQRHKTQQKITRHRKRKGNGLINGK